MTSSSYIMIAVALLIAWRMYSRIRRLIGRQKSRLWRHWLAATLLPLMIAMLAAGTLGVPLSLAALAAGIAGGVALAVWGLHLTRFEKTAQGYFYTPNAHIGIALSLLFVARIGYRVVTLAALTGLEIQQAMPGFGRSPLTLVIVGTMLGYFMWYGIGLLRWRRSAMDDASLTNGTLNAESPNKLST